MDYFEHTPFGCFVMSTSSVCFEKTKWSLKCFKGLIKLKKSLTLQPKSKYTETLLYNNLGVQIK